MKGAINSDLALRVYLGLSYILKKTKKSTGREINNQAFIIPGKRNDNGLSQCGRCEREESFLSDQIFCHIGCAM